MELNKFITKSPNQEWTILQLFEQVHYKSSAWLEKFLIIRKAQIWRIWASFTPNIFTMVKKVESQVVPDQKIITGITVNTRINDHFLNCCEVIGRNTVLLKITEKILSNLFLLWDTWVPKNPKNTWGPQDEHSLTPACSAPTCDLEEEPQWIFETVGFLLQATPLWPNWASNFQKS